MAKKKEFSIHRHNWSWEFDGKKHKVSLGNWTDAGWHWDGDGKDLNGFLVRLHSSQVADEFLKDMKEEGITFKDFKADILKSAEKGDGLYEMTGDNQYWHFGNYEFDEHSEKEDLQEIHPKLTEEEVKKIVEETIGDNPFDYDKFVKSYAGKDMKKELVDIVKKADSFENLFEEYGERHQDFVVEAITWSEGVNRENQDKEARRILRERGEKGYKYGGIVSKTGFAKVHKGELIIPKKTVQRVVKTRPLASREGQGGWFRHRKEHSIAARKGARTRRRRRRTRRRRKR